VKTWLGKFTKLDKVVPKDTTFFVKGDLTYVTPVILTTRQAKYVRDCLVKAYNPRKQVVVSEVSLTCLGFRHRGEILWMTNVAAMLHDIKQIAKKNKNEAAEIKAWSYLGHYDEILDRITCKATKDFKAFYHPNKLITEDGLCIYITPSKGDPLGKETAKPT